MRCFGRFNDDRICELCGLCNIDEYTDCRDETEKKKAKARESAVRIISATDIGGGIITQNAPVWWDVQNRPEDDRRER